MRHVSLKRPFTRGIITDAPAHDLGPQHTPFAQDGHSPQGVFKQRGGWAYDGTTADVADNLTSVYRNEFVLADVTRTLTGDDDGDLFIHNASASGTALFTGSVEYLPRAVYRDELLWCAQDGLTPLRRYSGAGFGSALSYTGTVSIAILESRVTGTLVLASDPGSGSYCMPAPSTSDLGPRRWYRALESSTSFVTLENVRPASASISLVAAGGTRFEGMGYTWPAVSIYDAGTASFTDSSGTIDGFGTVWSTGDLTINTGDANGPDAFLLLPSGNSLVYSIGSVVDDTELGGGGGNGADVAKSNYAITRRCPFKDVAAHKGSLWGTGVAPYPARVYVGPVGWDIAGPPGEPPPYDPAREMSSPNANDFLMDFVDVPSPFDGDPNVAILSSPNPLLVLKRGAVYGIYGSYPNFSVDLIADGIGCIDIRSAQSYDEGQFWAGENGIYWYTGGRIIDLTQGRINREWRDLTRDFDYGTSDYCTLSVSQGYLIVHITTAAGTIQRTYLCDLRDQSWQSRISNFTPRYMFTSRIDGEQEKLLAVSDARQGRVIDFAPALNGEGTAKDDAGSAPRLQAWTPEGIDGTDMDDDSRFIDMSINANVYDAGAAGSTSATVTVVTQDALTEDAPANLSLDDLDSDTTDRIDRHYYRSVNQRGRRHQVRIAVDTLGTDTAATKVEIHQIDATFRGTRNRT